MKLRALLVKPLYWIAVVFFAVGCAFTATATVIETGKAPKC